jgi:hypothetical protein
MNEDFGLGICRDDATNVCHVMESWHCHLLPWNSHPLFISCPNANFWLVSVDNSVPVHAWPRHSCLQSISRDKTWFIRAGSLVNPSPRKFCFLHKIFFSGDEKWYTGSRFIRWFWCLHRKVSEISLCCLLLSKYFYEKHISWFKTCSLKMKVGGICNPWNWILKVAKIIHRDIKKALKINFTPIHETKKLRIFHGNEFCECLENEVWTLDSNTPFSQSFIINIWNSDDAFCGFISCCRP